MHATHHHHLGVCVGGLACQRQRVAHKVGYILYIAHRIVVGEDDSVFFLTETAYLCLQIHSLAHWLVYVSFLDPFFFQHDNIIISFIFFFKNRNDVYDMPWIGAKLLAISLGYFLIHVLCQLIHY